MVRYAFHDISINVDSFVNVHIIQSHLILARIGYKLGVLRAQQE